jgi:ATP-dependent helicase/nuclease subunit B
MPVTFLIGRGGTGKTRWIYERIGAACQEDPLGAPQLLLVPEQASYQSEMGLLSQGGLSGYTRAQVLSFTRLAEYVFAQEKAPSLPHLTAQHRELLVAFLVEQERRTTGDKFYQATAIEEALAHFVQEAAEQATSPSDLRDALLRLEGRELPPEGNHLKRKLARLVTLLEQYEARIHERFQEPSQTLLRLADAISGSELLQGSSIYLDSFLGFRPVEERVLAALARKSHHLTIALPADPERVVHLLEGKRLARHPVFSAMEDVIRRLVTLFESNQIPVAQPIFLRDSHRFVAPGIASIEAAFYGGSPRSAAGVSMLRAETTRDEARLAAEQARRWLVENPEWSPGDVAIVARDLETYAPDLASAFTTLRIPHFMDRSEPLQTHPLIVAVRSLLQAAVQPGEAEPLLELGKSGLLPIDRGQLDLLEIHVRQHPRSRRAWLSDQAWPAPPSRQFDEDDHPVHDLFSEVIDSIRRQLIAEPVFFLQQLGSPNAEAEVPFSDFLTALWSTISRHLPWGTMDEREQRISLRFSDLLSEAHDVLGTDALPLRLCADFVTKCLAGLQLPRIPPLVGQLFVGQVDRSRVPPVRGMIVLGLVDGVFPKPLRNHSVLNDGERELLEEVGLNLRPSSRKLYERETFFAYRVLTAPSERLLVLRAVMGSEGPAFPSPFWREIERATAGEGNSLEFPAPAADDPARCWRARELALSVLRRVGRAHQVNSEQRPAQQILAALPGIGNATETARIIAAARWNNEALLAASDVARFHGRLLRTSASGLESFGHCPFQHFVQHMLAPRPVELPAFERRDAGNYAHRVMQNFTALLRERGVVGSAQPAVVDELFAAARAEPKKRLEGTSLLATPLGCDIHRRLDELLCEMAHWISDAYTELRIKPTREEVAFSASSTASLAPYMREDIVEGWKVRVTGRIDRLDQLPIEGSAGYGFVVDYKLTSRRFDLGHWAEGESLQLPLYLLAMEENAPVTGMAGGAFFLEIIPPREEDEYKDRKYKGIMHRDAVVKMLGGEPAKWNFSQSVELINRDPSGQLTNGRTALVSDEEFAALIEQTEALVENAAKGIIGGDVSVAPSRFGKNTACTHCKHRSICQIDYALNRARPKQSRTRAQVLSSLRQKAGDSNASI